MTTITGYTSAKMDAINDSVVDDAHLSGDDLVLVQRDLTEINVGSVRGPQGVQGVPGNDGADGATGPMNMVALAEQSADTSQYTSDATLSIALNNVPVVAGNRYGIYFSSMVLFSSLDVNAQWDIHARVNGTNYQRLAVLKPGITGNPLLPCRGECFWTAPATQSTDDFTIRAQNSVIGAYVIFSASSDLKRKLYIVDFGAP